MNERKIGGLVVTEGGKMVGIFTERDVLRRVVAEPHDPATTVLRDVMTTPVASCRSETTLEECVGVMTRKLRATTLTDTLTDLHNRRYAMKRLESEWASVIRTGRALSVVMVDIDYFKLVNDNYGHDT
ncbi:MAG: diguanylate cyclase, partial [Gemmatimonadetes bacterium]|nr:diguanylate cyclase [Gemmatimonadota bacterium]